ncbi:serine carboxypeptidase 1 [Carex littledalei]|uniref:Serine carboxypeptidase 1 n=1 Tax=Carex littledalei TaxID=544730 RepID=A0A833V367_9POAL|nr:serine carboxypeptidase 1 [Carex littledalei]
MHAEINGAPIEAQVKQFPGFHGDLLSKHYAGYITVGTELNKRHLHYHFVASERNPIKDPVTFFINGGPGCSAYAAIVHNIGPFKIDETVFRVKDPIRVKRHPYSWSKVSSLLFVDSPVGAGYSYAENEEDYVSDDSITVADLYAFLNKWFSEYSEFISNPFYIAGSSYSGVHVPLLAQEIVNGIYIYIYTHTHCNGAIDIHFENNYVVPFAYRMGFISDEQYNDLATSCGSLYWNNEHPDCKRNMEIFRGFIKGIYEYHVLCLPCYFKMGLSMEDAQYDSMDSIQSLHGESEYDMYCHDYEINPRRLFDTRTARELLHAMPEEITGPFERCSKRIKYSRNIFNLTPYHLNLTSKGYRTFFYNGDHDMRMPYIATLDWIKSLNYTEIEKWHPWFVGDQIAGYAVRFTNNLLFATLRGGGHTPFESMPRETLEAYQRWIDGADSL